MQHNVMEVPLTLKEMLWHDKLGHGSRDMSISYKVHMISIMLFHQ
jgi:hypothetical protein